MPAHQTVPLQRRPVMYLWRKRLEHLRKYQYFENLHLWNEARIEAQEAERCREAIQWKDKKLKWSTMLRRIAG